MRRLNAAAFAPEALRRASPKLGKNHAERRRELAEVTKNATTKTRKHEKYVAFFVSSCFRGCLFKNFSTASAASALNVVSSQPHKVRLKADTTYTALFVHCCLDARQSDKQGFQLLLVLVL